MSKSRFIRQWPGRLAILGLIFSALALLWVGCTEEHPDLSAPPQDQEQQEVVLSLDNPQVQEAIAKQDRHTAELMAIPDVVGVGTGMTGDGRPAIVVLTKRELKTRALDKQAPLPAEIEDVPVIEIVTGEIVALRKRPRQRIDPTARFDRPVPIGVSTGHPDITAGTIGCRVKDAQGNVYALSNNHVYANENLAQIGDAVIQPGTFDGGSLPNDFLGNLADFEPIVFSTTASNTIDAAIASTTTALLGNSTPSDGYGTPVSATVAPAVNMRVMKYGRTTGQTKGRVQAINATVNVGYDSGTARFVGQIVIGGGNFSAGGDSGSLIVVQKGRDQGKAVGLLFAGGGGVTIANPIDPVLNRFGVTIDGQ
ncbi:MAG: hypothetical protein D6681_11235 [Calditrichaeota bacterium]|nr:MAG: hypothetical protein D6681_11235 [Calditrichota bacterium]